jgi:hypothetical protein
MPIVVRHSVLSFQPQRRATFLVSVQGEGHAHGSGKRFACRIAN